ncbi:MAG: hypothetical protein OXE41_06805 [Gammaproteobacteria bacterium]|nr:hypothetical protein [Gammaproteobacteria bacterium]MCY4219822.1 hypothetical protein [Gammaproteobacteria bacterium]MCY4275086.1 hypothetical protein [Gammaproteobacteria bacterium]
MNDLYASRGPFMPLAGRSRTNPNPVLNYLPVILFFLLILGIVIYKSNTIPDRIASEVSQQLKPYPRLASVADVRGRTLVLEGSIDPFPGMDEAISQLASISGLRRLDDRLIRLNLASPYLHLIQNEDSIILTGSLNQEDFDSVIEQIQAAFPYLTIRHWIQIEDTVGTPLWLEGLSKSLNTLHSVKDLELRGWRNRLQLNGNIPNKDSQTLVRSMAASLVHRVEVENRIVEQSSTNQATKFSLRANQDGLELYATVKNREQATQIQNAAERVFGLVVGRIELNPNLENDPVLSSMLPLFPDLALVKDLRLMSDGNKYVVWGEVSSSNRLEKITQRIRELGMASDIKNKIHIHKSNTPAILTMLRYDKQITLSGKLPSSFVRNQLLESTREIFATKIIESSLDILQHVEYSTWIEIWPEVIKSIPLEVFGIAVDNSQVVLTGMPESEEQSQGIALRIGELLPDYQVRNWMRISDL